MRWYNLTMSTDNAVFRVGDAVVYPLQGVGSIISCEKRREREYYRIGIAASDMDVPEESGAYEGRLTCFYRDCREFPLQAL